MSFEKLESKNLLAGILLNSTTGELTIFGDANDNVGRLDPSGTTQYRASITGSVSKLYNRSEISKVTFIGFDGDDDFTNNTSVESQMLGNNGNDRLIGGSGFDRITGGPGTNEIRGNAGNDRLVGGSGIDMIFGGSGDDSIFGGDGANELFGSSGNDLIFGGNDNDMIFGEGGEDTLIGLAGDDLLSTGAGGMIGSSGSNQIRDLALGLDGNDTFVGAGGLNVFYGGNGDDVMTGGGGENRMHGQNGNDTLTGGPMADFLAGQLGNDEISGQAGNDFILGGHDDDVLRGGAGNDSIFGGIGNDSLYGEAGVDSLNGEGGNDGIFGGTASNESLTGGTGFDRFLIFGADSASDFGTGDATITFANSNSAWNDTEIEAIDVGLRQLHHRTGATTIFEDPYDEDPMTLTKVASLNVGDGANGFNSLEWAATWDGNGNIISETYTRSIQFAEWDESVQQLNENMSLVAIHEIAHSFDSFEEIQRVSPASASIWNQFLARSGWETSNPGAGHTRAPLQSQEPFDRRWNGSTFVINTHTWWRDTGANFARDYGTSNPQEDWATAWESLFVDAIVENPHDGHASVVTSKTALINRLLDAL